MGPVRRCWTGLILSGGGFRPLQLVGAGAFVLREDGFARQEGAFLAVEDAAGEVVDPLEGLEAVFRGGDAGDEAFEEGEEEALSASAEDDGDVEGVFEEEGAQECLLDGGGHGFWSWVRSCPRRIPWTASAATTASWREG